MSATGIEIIDLTNSAPQSPAISPNSIHVRSLRAQKGQRPDGSSTRDSPIVISESDNEDAPSTPKSSDTSMKRRLRKKKQKASQLEEGEIPLGSDGTGSGRQKDSHSNGDNRGKRQKFTQSNSYSHSNSTQLRHTSPAPLFYLDDKPEHRSDDFLNTDGASNSVGATNSAKSDLLLLPDHVVLDSGLIDGASIPAEVSAMVESDTDDFILYADAELNVFTRYYEEPKEDTERKAHLVCGQCGAEGDHKQADCPVVVCLTCGAHNEHTTRQCPIVKTCFGCGMKGHIREDCPNKKVPRCMTDRGHDCTRCGSYLHAARECPTLWRMYEYVDDAEREATLRTRREKENLPIGKGGEGYIGEDYWCYNCGGEGHLGDDCAIEPLQSDSKEPSAFSSSNIMSGPFADYQRTQTSKRKLRREWEIDGNFDDGHGFAGPSDVGRRGRDKERERMRRREKELQEVDEDEEDWFGHRLQSSSRPKPPSLSKGRKTADDKKFNGLRNGDRPDRDKRRPHNKLLDRISFEGRNRPRERDSEGNHRGMRDREGGRERGSSRRETSRRETSNRAERRRGEEGSRQQYFGGYSR